MTAFQRKVQFYKMNITHNTLLQFTGLESISSDLHNNDVGWLVGWVLWHINHCRLFNAKSIFIHINSSIPNN